MKMLIEIPDSMFDYCKGYLLYKDKGETHSDAFELLAIAIVAGDKVTSDTVVMERYRLGRSIAFNIRSGQVLHKTEFEAKQGPVAGYYHFFCPACTSSIAINDEYIKNATEVREVRC